MKKETMDKAIAFIRSHDFKEMVLSKLKEAILHFDFPELSIYCDTDTGEVSIECSADDNSRTKNRLKIYHESSDGLKESVSCWAELYYADDLDYEENFEEGTLSNFLEERFPQDIDDFWGNWFYDMVDECIAQVQFFGVFLK